MNAAPRHIRARRRPSTALAVLRAPLIAALAGAHLARCAGEFTADVIEGWAAEADVWAGGHRPEAEPVEVAA